MALDPTRIGYLRQAAALDRVPSVARGPAKAMLRKLVSAGYAVSIEVDSQEGFVRTEDGEREIQEFDRGLSAENLDVLKAIRDGRKHDYIGKRGIVALMAAGLVRIEDDLENTLTPDAETILGTAATLAGPR
jgi:hypothetical protein